MSDLIERLYEPCRRWKRCKDTRYDAIDHIEKLEAENAKLREALQSIVIDVSSQRQTFGLAALETDDE